MEKYEAILRAINSKLADYEMTVEYYREEMPKKDARIRELEEEITRLKEKIDNLTF